MPDTPDTSGWYVDEAEFIVKIFSGDIDGTLLSESTQISPAFGLSGAVGEKDVGLNSFPIKSQAIPLKEYPSKTCPTEADPGNIVDIVI